MDDEYLSSENANDAAPSHSTPFLAYVEMELGGGRLEEFVEVRSCHSSVLIAVLVRRETRTTAARGPAALCADWGRGDLQVSDARAATF